MARPGRRRRAALSGRLARIGGLALLALAVAPRAGAAAAALLFDDFSAADTAALRAGGWQLRTAPGHPGPSGAHWSPAAVTLVDDPARRGNRLLRLSAATDGSAAGTQQAQVCQARKFLRGTYAARVRLTDVPDAGPDGDPVVQAFYAIGELRHDLDPDFSEVDFEYLPNGGWGSPRPRLYGISWHTVQLEPWRAFNAAHEAFGAHPGWHVLAFVVDAHTTRHYLDGRLLARHAARHVPVTPMSINFSLWFSPAGLLAGPAPRRWSLDVDWVLHVPGRALAPRALPELVTRLRRRGIAQRDTVPAAVPPLPSACAM